MPLAPLKSMVSWRPGRLARNTAHAGMWNAVRIVLQAANLILLARAFGADGYGALSGTMALFITVAQFVGFGTGIALLRHVSREGVAHGKLRATQHIFLATGIAIFLVVWPLSLWWFGDHLSGFALANLAFAELVVVPTLLPLSYRYQATEQLSVSGGLLTIAPIARCVAITAALLLSMRSVDAFAVLYLASLLVAVGIATFVLWPRRAPPEDRSLRAEIREGLPYAVSGAATTAGGELDKTMMLRFAGDLVTGQYAAASRVMQAALLPVNSLVIAVAPRWFKGGRGPVVGTGSGRLFALAFAYSLVAAAGLWVVAPFLPWLLGRDFEPSVHVLRLLTAALVTGAARQIMAMLLTTSDLQGTRNRIEIVSIALALGLMPLLIPRYGGAGAVVALVTADLFVLALGLAALMRHDRRARSPGPR